ncbi:MAG: hypothetical protein ACFB21_04540 [Opitutales bacterium]
MKKTLFICAFAGVGALSAQTGSGLGDLSVSGTFAYESEYIFRGEQFAQHSFQPGVELAFPVVGGSLYGGVWANMPINDNEDAVAGNPAIYGNEIDFYAGYAIDVTDIISLDAGFTYYWFPEATVNAGNPPAFGGDEETEEIFAGIGADVLLSPAAYFYYDFSLETFTIELSSGYSFDLGDYAGVDGASIDTGGYLGFVFDQTDGEQDRVYWGINVDLVYALSENVSASVGARYAGNDKDSDRSPSDDDSHLWWGASIGFAY